MTSIKDFIKRSARRAQHRLRGQRGRNREAVERPPITDLNHRLGLLDDDRCAVAHSRSCRWRHLELHRLRSPASAPPFRIEATRQCPDPPYSGHGPCSAKSFRRTSAARNPSSRQSTLASATPSLHRSPRRAHHLLTRPDAVSRVHPPRPPHRPRPRGEGPARVGHGPLPGRRPAARLVVPGDD